MIYLNGKPATKQQAVNHISKVAECDQEYYLDVLERCLELGSDEDCELMAHGIEII